MSTQTIPVGAPVRVTMPDGVFTGTVREVWPNQNVKREVER